jgi:hypothetical protein
VSDFGNSADGRRDEGRSTRGSLKEDVGNAFRPAGQYEKVGSAEPVRQLGVGLRTVKANSLPEPCDGHLFIEPAAHLAFPDEVKFPGADALRQAATSIEEDIYPLYRLEVADVKQVLHPRSEGKPLAGRGAVAWTKDRQINPVGDNTHPIKLNSEAHYAITEVLRNRDHTVSAAQSLNRPLIPTLEVTSEPHI